MTYRTFQNDLDLPTIVVNDSIYFAWDPNDLDNYGVFLQKLEEKGIEVFAQLLSNDPNTAFNLFCEFI
jgi:hypothetical protein